MFLNLVVEALVVVLDTPQIGLVNLVGFPFTSILDNNLAAILIIIITQAKYCREVFVEI